MDDILDHAKLTPWDLQFWQQGELVDYETYTTQGVVDPEGARKLMAAGIGCRMMNYGRFDDELREVQNALQKKTRDHITLNLYLSYRDQFMLKVHSDFNSTCVLQIEGQKKWYIYEEKKNHHLEPVEITLSPGDMLFIRRNICHKAIATTEKSEHLTFGFQPKELAILVKNN